MNLLSLLFLFVVFLNPVYGTLQEDITSYVNIYRSNHNSQLVQYSITLSEFANNWANTLANTNTFQHSGGPYGENLAMFGYLNMNDVDFIKTSINMWYAEISKYDFNNPKYDSSTGHFTQLVWNSTYEIGFALSKNSKNTFVVMEYFPPGNIIGKFNENVFPKIALPIQPIIRPSSPIISNGSYTQNITPILILPPVLTPVLPPVLPHVLPNPNHSNILNPFQFYISVISFTAYWMLMIFLDQ